MSNNQEKFNGVEVERIEDVLKALVLSQSTITNPAGVKTKNTKTYITYTELERINKLYKMEIKDDKDHERILLGVSRIDDEKKEI